MSMTSESDERMISKNGIDSSPVDDASSGGNVGGNGPLKKGPWTSAEDAILVEYVTKHGEGNWNAVHKHSGLSRCGKSCRLRWANHLRPDLKKGAFTPEEERRIIELHAKMGNKWARMAAELPGRTDNEIKNYWNTRIKRRQRAGLPIYPPDICLQTLNEDQHIHDINTFQSTDAHNPDFMPMNNFEIPALEFKSLELNQLLYPPALLDIPSGSLLDIPPSSLLAQGLHPSYSNKPFLSAVHPPKRLRGSESLFHGLSPAAGNVIPSGNLYHQNNVPQQICQPFIFSSAYNHSSNSNHASSSIVLPGSHASLNGNPSSSEPAWAMKLELPSLQTQTGSWGSPSSPLPSLDCVDTLIQTPPTEQTQSSNISPRNSGLLDAVLYESQTMKNSTTCREQPSFASGMLMDVMDTSSQDINETEWQAYGEPRSPLGHSSSSVFSEGSPASGNSMDEHHSVETNEGCKVKEEAVVPMQYDENSNTASQMLFSRPDFMLASNCFVPEKDCTKDHPLFKDSIGSFLVDDLGKDCKHMDTSTTSSAQGHGHDTCPWNAMSTV